MWKHFLSPGSIDERTLRGVAEEAHDQELPRADVAHVRAVHSGTLPDGQMAETGATNGTAK